MAAARRRTSAAACAASRACPDGVESPCQLCAKAEDSASPARPTSASASAAVSAARIEVDGDGVSTRADTADTT